MTPFLSFVEISKTKVVVGPSPLIDRLFYIIQPQTQVRGDLCMSPCIGHRMHLNVFQFLQFTACGYWSAYSTSCKATLKLRLPSLLLAAWFSQVSMRMRHGRPIVSSDATLLASDAPGLQVTGNDWMRVYLAHRIPIHHGPLSDRLSVALSWSIPRVAYSSYLCRVPVLVRTRPYCMVSSLNRSVGRSSLCQPFVS